MQIATIAELGLDSHQLWNTDTAHRHLMNLGVAKNKRSTHRILNNLNFLPPLLRPELLQDEFGQNTNRLVLNWAIDKAHKNRTLVLFAQLNIIHRGISCLHLNDARGGRYWLPLHEGIDLNEMTSASQIFKSVQHHFAKDVAIFPHGKLVTFLRNLEPLNNVRFELSAFQPILKTNSSEYKKSSPTPHLLHLENESIHIIREAIAEAENPVMLYSIGKDSSVMLHLARKAFYPAPPPFPLLHVDTRWKFKEMYLFRDAAARDSGMELIVHINPEAIARDINPFIHGSALHTDITKTEGLKQALNKYKFDVIFGGARRDEEKSRAKERIFSFRNQAHQWEPKQQRPELWNIFNTKKNQGESIRVFPLSNWTEIDIWQYIYQENIPIAPLYFAKKRPVVFRDGMILMIDDDRFKFTQNEKIVEKSVRFRTLGCYPLTGAVESEADTFPKIILELLGTRTSERQGRAIDSDSSASMEKKKKEGYF